VTSFSDSGGDMRDDQPLDDPLLTDFLSELRSWGTGPAPVPSQALTRLLDGADHVEPDPPPLTRRRKMLVPKIAAMGLAAKAALGLGIATAAVATAGMAGALPAPAQNTVAAVVNAVTPLDLPRAAVATDVTTDPTTDVTTDPTTDVTTDPSTTLPGDGDGTGDDPVESGTPANHGACVSAIAKDKSVTGREHGQAVSEAARSDCGKTVTSTPTTTSTSTSIPGDETVGTSGVSGPGASAGHGNRGSAGQGNKGQGDKGQGNNGKSGSAPGRN
jgi:hypothetical protein